ncbi:MAG TPA: DNA polymerase III subunit alpha, partial [Kiloniellales bacterium]|nr:DNA polymerase III subunit alpha [Kiloniellales bacterium]
MSHANFVHLRCHSAYSLSQGALRLKELVGLCVRERMPAVAVTDNGNLFGALEFAGAAREAGVQPVIGCLLPVSRMDSTAGPGALAPPPDLLPLLVQDERGYLNLLKLVSAAYLESDPQLPPQVSLAQLAERAQGLLALTGGPQGALNRLLGEGQRPAAETWLARLEAAFMGRLYVELQRHGLQRETAVEPALLDLAYARELPLVATNDCHFATAELYEAHDALLCIANGTTIGDGERPRLTPHHRFKSAAEMRALFADLPEAADNTLLIARRCAFFPEKVKPILPAYPTSAGRSEPEELRVKAEEGLAVRLEHEVYRPGQSEAEREAAAKPYRERLDYELGVIVEMGFPGYFLIVADFIQWAKAQGIPVGPGRGSGAGSVVAWSLTITDLDPLRWNLLFERFLNPERVSMPDFDIDFCQDRRDEVIRYVQEKYGRDRVAQIITFGKLQARAALRDVGRVLQMPYGYIDKLCKLVPMNPANPVTLAQAIEGEPQLQAYRESDPDVARLMDIALKLEGLYRHASTHAAGVVIGNRPLEELIPLYRDPRSDMPVTQFSMKYVEDAGLVKFDFLGLKTLTVLAEAEALIRRNDPSFQLARIPLDDKRTYDMLGRAETVGIFQLESTGMKQAVRDLKPDRLEDIIALVALYRPGPMASIPSYIARKNGKEAPDYLYPTLEPILRETYGVIVYQEQVMQIARELSGYSLGGADLLRRAMGKKIKAEMDAQKRTFIDGALARGVPQATADHIFDLVERFAGYGFNKCHAAPYALLAYQTAYLKANHPVAFFAASMTLDLGNTDKLQVFRREAQRLKVAIRPPE